MYDGGVSGLAFSPDSRRLAYAASEGGKGFLVVDGVEDKRYESAARPIFSPDSRRLAYEAGRGGKSLAVIGGVEGPEYNSVEFGRLFSPDGRRTAYKAGLYDENTGSWKHAAVIDGALGKPYTSIVEAPVFSPDSRHVAFLAQRDDKRYVIVVDGGESQAYDDYAGDGKPVFDRPDLLRAVMVRNGEGLRVEIRIR